MLEAEVEPMSIKYLYDALGISDIFLISTSSIINISGR